MIDPANLYFLGSSGMEGGHAEVGIGGVLKLAVGALGAFSVLLSAAVFLLMWLRRRSYERQEREGSGGVATSGFDEAYTAIKNTWWMPVHKRGIRAQNKYWMLVFGYSTSILMAFVFLTVGVVFLSHDDTYVTFVAWFELFCFVAMFVFYKLANTVNRQWLALRVEVELLRQASIVAVTALRSPEALADCAASGSCPGFDVLRHKIGTLLAEAAKTGAGSAGNPLCEGELQALILAYASSAELAAALDAVAAEEEEGGDAGTRAARFYYFRRIARQDRWFRRSEERVMHGQHRRERVLGGLFLLGAATVLVKVCIYSLGHHPEASNCLSAILLMITAVAGAMTATSLNSNSRSLAHKYRMQGRMISALKARFSRIEESTAAEADIAALLAEVADFEPLMIVELSEWVAITARDRLELGP